MAFALNGFGTTYYGQRDFRADGSYVTTEWVILLFVPVLPLRSFRVIAGPEIGDYYYVYSSRSKSYIIVERLPLVREQVLSVYGLISLALVWSSLLVILSILFGAPWNTYPGVLAIITVCLASLPFSIPLILRKRAKRDVIITKEAFITTLKDLGINPEERAAKTQDPEYDAPEDTAPRRHSPSEGYYDY
jgi:hypothetical protein